jgi:hypothetical protein
MTVPEPYQNTINMNVYIITNIVFEFIDLPWSAKVKFSMRTYFGI